MKFLADMGISPKSALFLRDLGYDSFHLNELGLGKFADSDILLKAKIEGFVVLTHDLDFSELMAASKAKLPSVITFRLRNMKAENVNRYLKKILNSYQNELQTGVVISVTEGLIRIRKLPILE